MKLVQMKPYNACVLLKEALVASGFLHEQGVKSADNIYVGAAPTEGLPDIYATLMVNGNMRDMNEYALNTVLLGLYVPLINGQPNVGKSKYVFDRLNDILSEPLYKDYCWFYILQDFAVSENINLSNGYSATFINIQVKIINNKEL